MDNEEELNEEQIQEKLQILEEEISNLQEKETEINSQLEAIENGEVQSTDEEKAELESQLEDIRQEIVTKQMKIVALKKMLEQIKGNESEEFSIEEEE